MGYQAGEKRYKSAATRLSWAPRLTPALITRLAVNRAIAPLAKSNCCLELDEAENL
ncbi:MAG: hypothetical protein QGG19_02910 [Alphaproteobacteria bacterium]|jgi:hypothetical protein|nr:hypothetical protein [Alphaproteobacteria bacterium]MDP7054307.1 hypothetical protein [Alphaproteobacteria bacterium]MDP7230604.1 hypothetical protein [Alphaproteobacteria bacterium]|tara:strand:- start:74 stop:241 length:168 start_codon:yes stop_codon:yes gene_type:complete